MTNYIWAGSSSVADFRILYTYLDIKLWVIWLYSCSEESLPLAKVTYSFGFVYASCKQAELYIHGDVYSLRFDLRTSDSIVISDSRMANLLILFLLISSKILFLTKFLPISSYIILFFYSFIKGIKIVKSVNFINLVNTK